MKEKATDNKKKWIVLAVVTIIAAGAISYFASPSPDGLERVATNHGFMDRAKAPAWKAWIANYEFPGIRSSFMKGGLAGVVGIALLFGGLYGLTKGLTRGKGAKDDGKSDSHSS